MRIFGWFKDNFLLIVILLIAIILRFIAVNPGYNPYHGDETAIWGSSIQMVRKDTLDPGRYDYPATTMLINVFFYKYYFIPVSWVGYYLNNLGEIVDGTVKIPPTAAEIKRIFGIYIVGERDINAIFWSRYVTAIFGVGSVFLTYVLAKRMFSHKVGLLAALFLTFNYRNVVNSHLALPDIYNAFFVLLSLITCWDLIEKPSRLKYILAGIATGLAFSIKYQFFSGVPLAFAHLVIVFRNGFNLKKVFDMKIVTAGLCVILIFLLTNPYFFMNIEAVIVKMGEGFLKYGMGANTLNFYPLSYLYHIDYGPAQFALVLMGIVIGITRKTFKSIFLLSILIPIFYMFIYYSRGGFYVRNFIVTTPILLILASVAFWQVTDFVTSKFGKVFSFIFLIPILIFVMYVPAKNSILSSYGYTLPWGYETLKPWVEKNIPKDVVIGAHPFDRSSLNIKNKTTEFSPSEAYALAEHVENGDEFVIVDLNWASLPFYFWMSYGPEEVDKLWDKPLNTLKNTFHGVAAEELFRYQIHTSTKPWQSPDTHFVIVKVPKWPVAEMKKIKSFSFDENQGDWTIRNIWLDLEKDRYQFDSKVGKNQVGSIAFVPGKVRFPAVRISSPIIPIKSGHFYKVSSYIKTDKELKSKERDGFIRIDFYDDVYDLEKTGVTSSVSSRVYGTNDWVLKEVMDRAPDSAKYMTISFQMYANLVTTIWLDDVIVMESKDKVEDITAKSPYTKEFIDLNYLYPNSHGNL